MWRLADMIWRYIDIVESLLFTHHGCVEPVASPVCALRCRTEVGFGALASAAVRLEVPSQTCSAERRPPAAPLHGVVFDIFGEATRDGLRLTLPCDPDGARRSSEKIVRKHEAGARWFNL